MPKVSVIIPTYNREKYICESINSVLDQACQDFEIIVVDDGSSDNTKNLLLPYGDKIRYLYKKNEGQSAARNHGILNSKGKYICFLDSDDLYLPEKLSLQLSYLEANPEIDIIYSNYSLIDENNNLLPAKTVRLDVQELKFERILLGEDFFPIWAAMFRKLCFDQTGLFDVSLDAVEDWDIMLRLAINKYKVKHIERSLYLYRNHSKSIIKDRNLVTRSTLRVLNKIFISEAFPDTKYTYKKEIYFRLFYDAAWYFYYDGVEKKSQRYLFKAIRLNPHLLDAPASFTRFINSYIPPQKRSKEEVFSQLLHIEKQLISFLDYVFKRERLSSNVKNRKMSAYSNAYLALGEAFYFRRNMKKARQYLTKGLATNLKMLKNPYWMIMSFKSFLGTYLFNNKAKRLDDMVLAESAISVIICTKDRPDETATCIDSIFQQKLLPDEIVVIDSSIQTKLGDIINKLQSKILNIRFKYIHTTPGLTHQRNVGIKNSSGDILVFLDDDVVLKTTFIEEISKPFHFKKVGGVMGNIVNAKNTDIPFSTMIKRKLFFLPEYGNGRFKLSGASTNPIGRKSMSRTEYLAGGLTAYRKEVFSDFMFDEDYFTGSAYLEDDDFSYRVSRKYINMYNPYAECFHYDASNNKLSGEKLRNMHIRNFEYFFNKNIPKNFMKKVAFRITLFGLKNKVDQLPFSQIIALVLEKMFGKKITSVPRVIYKKLLQKS